MNSMQKTVCVFSGKRGGFGAYVPLMRLLEDDPDFKLQILLGDMHASAEFGRTADEARSMFPKSRIEIIEMGAGRGDTPLIRAENLGAALAKGAGLLAKMRPDIVMVHADRGEHLVIALAALNLGIPVAHPQGGEVSGNIDDIQRHAITKLAHIHFPETEEAAGRIRCLGEESWRINTVGSLYIDRIVKKLYTPAEAARAKYGFGSDERYGIIITHPDTYLSRDQNEQMAEAVFGAADNSGLSWVATYPCSDPGYEGVIAALEKRKDDAQFRIHKNIGNLDFLGLIAGAELILGNSSSALVEAPYFKLPAVNVGKRQIGRDREENVVDVEPHREAIAEKIKFVLEDAAYRAGLERCGRRLGDGHASEKILEILRAFAIDERLMRKRLASTA